MSRRPWCLDRLPSKREHLAAERAAGSRELWRLQCAHHLAGAVEAQVLMAAGAAADVAHGDSAPVMLAGWEPYAGAGMEGDAARIGLLIAMTKRQGDQIMLMVARHRRGEGDELLSPLVMPALAVCEALAGVLDAAAAPGNADRLALVSSSTATRRRPASSRRRLQPRSRRVLSP